MTLDGSFTLWIFTVMDRIVFESFRNFMSYVAFFDFLMCVILVRHETENGVDKNTTLL